MGEDCLNQSKREKEKQKKEKKARKQMKKLWQKVNWKWESRQKRNKTVCSNGDPREKTACLDLSIGGNSICSR